MTTALTDRIVARYMRETQQRQADQTVAALGVGVAKLGLSPDGRAPKARVYPPTE
jgi:hypothetical protein